MQIQERDVHRKVDLIASLAESETGGVANNFSMQWNLADDGMLWLITPYGLCLMMMICTNLHTVGLHTCGSSTRIRNPLPGTMRGSLTLIRRCGQLRSGWCMSGQLSCEAPKVPSVGRARQRTDSVKT